MWGFLTAATVCVFGCGMVAIITDYMNDRKKLILKHRREASLSDGVAEEMVSRLERLEERMANIESVVLDLERYDAFDRSLSAR